MFCKWCGKEVDSNSKFCPNCGKEILNSQSASSLNQEVNSSDEKNKKANIWLAILSFFIPLAGLIIFIIKKDKEPKTAKASGICAIVGLLLNIIISIICLSLIISVGRKSQEKVVDDAKDIFNDVIDAQKDMEEQKEEDYYDKESSNDWDDYEFIVNNQKLELPCSYDELKKATGFSMKSSDENSVLSNNYYAMVNLYKNNNLSLYIEILNNLGRDAKYIEGKITRVSQTEYQVSKGADVITFPGNLKVGDSITQEKIKELFGEPNDISEYSNDGYESKTFKYNEDKTWTTTNYYEIKVVNGVIDEITLDNRDCE